MRDRRKLGRRGLSGILVAICLMAVSLTVSPAASASDDSVSIPEFVSVGDTGDFVSVIWEVDTSLTGVDVYRNGVWKASVNMNANVYNDHSGKAGDMYRLVGYRDGKHSLKTDPNKPSVQRPG